MKCLYCDFDALNERGLQIHQNKYHEKLLALKGNERAEEEDGAVEVKEHPGWPVPHREGIGFKDCLACHGFGMVTIHVPMSDERWGSKTPCPKCYPGQGAVPRLGKKPSWDMKKHLDTDELNAIGDEAIKVREARWAKVSETVL